MASPSGPAPSWPPYPPALLAALQAAAPPETPWSLGLWSGETIRIRRIVSQTEEGLLAELEPAPGVPEDTAPGVVAVPWYAICRLEVLPRAARRARPGFRPEL